MNPFLDPRAWSLPTVRARSEPAGRGRELGGQAALGRRLCIPASISQVEAHPIDEDDIDESDDDGGKPSVAPLAGWEAPPTPLGKPLAGRTNPQSLHGAARSSFVSHLSLRGAQLGQTVSVSASGRSGSRRDLGPHQANAYRAANQHQDDERTLRVRFGINGGAPATALHLRSAMAEVRHKVLRLVHVRCASPLVIADCEENDNAEDVVRVVMQPATFQRVCGSGGRRFVIFGPWSERSNGTSNPTLLVSHAEALANDAMLAEP